jgi:signal transduction histidine kinase
VSAWSASGRLPDLAIAAVIWIVVMLGTLPQIRSVDDLTGAGAVAWLLIAASCGALCLRRRYPVAVAAATLGAVCVYYPLDVPDGPIVLAFVVALYTVAAQGRFAASAVLAVIAVLAVVVGEAGSSRPLGDAGSFLLVGWLVAVIVIGRTVWMSELAKQAAARRGAGDERARIARELHDALAHGMSVINVQASSALHCLGDDPKPAREALTIIKQTSQRTFRELRDTLGALRQADASTPPRITDVQRLVEDAGRAGIAVRTEYTGKPRRLSGEVDLAVYRIIQEALTNVVRHAEASTAVVRLDFGRRALLMSVEDDGSGMDPILAGNGITGMRERAAELGGELDATRRREGGFRVSARIPLVQP